MTVAEACTTYLRELATRNHHKSTLASYRYLFRQLESFARDTGVESLEGLDKDAVRKWREQWDCAHSTQRRRLSQLRPFFLYAKDEGWVSMSPLKGVRSPSPMPVPRCLSPLTS